MNHNSRRPQETVKIAKPNREALVKQLKPLIRGFDILKIVSSVAGVAALVGLGLFYWLGADTTSPLIWAIPLGVAAVSGLGANLVGARLQALLQDHGVKTPTP